VLKPPTATEEGHRPSARTPPPPSPVVASAAVRLGILATGRRIQPGDVVCAGEDSGMHSETKSADPRIQVLVRKRPLNAREGGDDIVEVTGKKVHLCATKRRVDLTE